MRIDVTLANEAVRMLFHRGKNPVVARPKLHRVHAARNGNCQPLNVEAIGRFQEIRGRRQPEMRMGIDFAMRPRRRQQVGARGKLPAPGAGA